MAEIREDQLRSLIRLIPPARALKEQVETSLHTETFEGTGDYAARTFQGLHGSVARLVDDDPYVASLALNIPADAEDKGKVSLTLLASTQLVAYLEGQTGLGGFGGGGHNEYHNAPYLNGVSIAGVSEESAGKAVEMIADMMKGKKPEDE